jgi:hypothetical protein
MLVALRMIRNFMVFMRENHFIEIKALHPFNMAVVLPDIEETEEILSGLISLPKGGSVTYVWISCRCIVHREPCIELYVSWIVTYFRDHATPYECLLFLQTPTPRPYSGASRAHPHLSSLHVLTRAQRTRVHFCAIWDYISSS